MNDIEVAQFLIKVNTLKARIKKINKKLDDLLNDDDMINSIYEYFKNQLGEEKGSELTDILLFMGDPVYVSDFTEVKPIFIYEVSLEGEIEVQRINGYIFKDNLMFKANFKFKNKNSNSILINTPIDSEWKIHDDIGFIQSFEKDDNKAAQIFYNRFVESINHVRTEHADEIEDNEDMQDWLDDMEYIKHKLEENYDIDTDNNF